MPCRLLPLHQACLRRSPYWIAGRRRFPRTTRNFHASQLRRTTPHESPSSPDSAAGSNANREFDAEPGFETGSFSHTKIHDSPESGSRSTEKPSPSPYGSATRRAMRNRRPRERNDPVAVVPDWLYERNLIISEKGAQSALPSPNSLGIKHSNEEVEESKHGAPQDGDGDGGNGKGGSGPSEPDNRYFLSQTIWKEICASAKAGLTLPRTSLAHDPSSTKAHLVLQYPGDGGIFFLDAIVKSLAAELDTNLLTLNAQDIAELYSEQTPQGSATASSIPSMGYEVFQSSKSAASKEIEEDVEEDDEESSSIDEDDSDSLSNRGLDNNSVFTRAVPMSGGHTGSSNLPSILQGLLGGNRGLLGVARVHLPPDVKDEVDNNGEELRCLRLINELLSSPDKKRDEKAAPPPENSNESTPQETKTDGVHPDLIIQIQDYKDIQDSRSGAVFLPLLHKAIQTRRSEGQRVIIIGTVSGKKSGLSFGKAYPRLAQKDASDEFARTIVTTPAMTSQAVESVFTEDTKRRFFEVNIRHLGNMIRARTPGVSSPDRLFKIAHTKPSDENGLRDSGLEDGYWSFDRVHRIITLALGCAQNAGNLSLEHIQRGIELVEQSDRIKSDWMAEKYPRVKATPAEPDRENRIKQLRKTCNSHEKKLLNGVVDAESIRTTFDDVHAAKETVEALKTLTSLSLVRPDAFTYGVLATDKIPGLLLYGPPGTGKTLLAKAVARQSGATVLEVSGSEVYDMYVGEGEKNVKAIFTLAKKLSPCVVFIDEADAIFCSRVGASSRTSHRELINQFLREWDGMNEMSAFIMVATNRPFDLDDAVLRRLPRRLLVDLPTEKDRLSILKIHLKEETLDQTIDLADLARRTPLYSGSDLKNMCVAAALACVREENEQAARHTGDEPYKYPERRILKPSHFDKAMEEISASISEDMGSLSAVKKFDEKYGDRKGRRKKSSGWGFSSPGEDETVTETGRVRN